MPAARFVERVIVKGQGVFGAGLALDSAANFIVGAPHAQAVLQVFRQLAERVEAVIVQKQRVPLDTQSLMKPSDLSSAIPPFQSSLRLLGAARGTTSRTSSSPDLEKLLRYE